MNINKDKFWSLLTKETNRFVHSFHIMAVMSILIDEIRKDLVAGKDIKIANFGTFKLKQTNQRNFKSVVTNNIETSKRKNKLELKLMPKLARYIARKIDEDLKDE